MQARFFISSFLMLLLVLPGWLQAADLFTSGADSEPVGLEADQLSFDNQDGRYLAKGNVRLKQGDLRLSSDELWLHRESGDLEAVGSVLLESAQERVVGKKIHYNLNDQTGFIEDGRVFLYKQNLRVSGARIEKRGEVEYRIVDGSFTTCAGDVPAWKFSASQLDVTVDGYAQARNAVFYLKDIPSLYVPYIIYPTNTDRESGLLMPRFGYSDRRGMEFSAAYYQVISRNQDATLYLDSLSSLGIGKGLEYRYVFGQDNAGEASGYHIDTSNGGDDRYALAWDHMGTLPGQVRLTADTEYVSDRDFFEEFGEEAEDYNKDQSLSVVSLTRNRGLYSLVGQLRYSKNLERDDPTLLQWLPRVSLDSVRQQVGATPFYFKFGSGYTYFWREEGMKSQRLIARPALLAPFKIWGAVDVVPEIGWTERHYWTSDDGPGHEQNGLYDFSTRLNSRFYRVYSKGSGSVSRIRHMVEPDVTYRYVQDVNQEKLPEFDSFDRIDEINRIEYGLTQRVTTRSDSANGVSEYRDLLFFRLSQSYDLLLDGKVNERVSSLRGQFSLDPTEYFQISTDSRYDFDRGRWDEYSAESGLHDQRGNRLGVTYRRRKVSPEEEEVDYGSLNLALSQLRPVYLGYRNRYDFKSSKALEQVLDIEYRHQCWSVLLTFREWDAGNSFMLSFSLGGIGMVGSVGGSMGGS